MTPVEYVAHELGRFEAELAALRVVERDSDPTPPHGIERPASVDGYR